MFQIKKRFEKKTDLVDSLEERKDINKLLNMLFNFFIDESGKIK